MPSSACDWSSDVCSSDRSEEHTSELQSRSDLVCRLLLEKKNQPRSYTRLSAKALAVPIGAAETLLSQRPRGICIPHKAHQNTVVTPLVRTHDVIKRATPT